MKYLVDGRYLTKEEVLSLFREGSSPPGKRYLTTLKMVASAISEAKGANPFRFLDVGCYAGGFVRLVRKAYPEIEALGCDYFQDNIAIARLVDPKNESSYIKMSVYSLGFPDSFLDCISFQDVIEHLDRPVDAVREINRVLKPGGSLVITTPNAVSLHNLLLALYHGYRDLFLKRRGKKVPPPKEVFFANVEWNRHMASWTATTLGTLLLANGFEYAEHEIVGETWYERLVPGLAGNLVFRVKKTSLPPRGFI